MTCAGDCNRGANSSEELVMAKYMLAVHSCDGELREPMSAEEMQRSWQQIGVLEAEMKSVGVKNYEWANGRASK